MKHLMAIALLVPLFVIGLLAPASSATEITATTPDFVVLADDNGGQNGGGQGDGKEGQWDRGPQAPPGLKNEFPKWVGWAKYVAIGAGIIGFIACAIMMMVGRRNRSHLAAEGASGLLWVMAGLSVVTLSAGIVTAMIS